jgi:amino acid transporter
MADRLRKNTIGMSRLIWQGWGITTPEADIAFLLGGIALVAPGATPLSILIGFLIYLTILNTSYRFSQRYVSAGNDFTYLGKGLGGFMATFEGWNLLFGTMFAFAGFGMLGLAAFFDIFDANIVTSYLWIPIVLALNVSTFLIFYRGIVFSTSYQMISGIIEFIVLISGGIGLIILAGKNNTLVVFNPFISSGGIVGFIHSLTLSVVAFIGPFHSTDIHIRRGQYTKKECPQISDCFFPDNRRAAHFSILRNDSGLGIQQHAILRKLTGQWSGSIQ